MAQLGRRPTLHRGGDERGSRGMIDSGRLGCVVLKIAITCDDSAKAVAMRTVNGEERGRSWQCTSVVFSRW